MKDMVIVGSGGFAREVRWLVESCNDIKPEWNILGWVSKEKPGTIIDELPVLGDDDWLLNYDKPIAVALGFGSGALREKVVKYVSSNKNIEYPKIISSTARLHKHVKIGEGAIITDYSIIAIYSNIGKFFVSNLASTVGHDCVFGDFVTLNPGSNVSGNVHMGDRSTTGTGATVNEGINIGKDVMIGGSAAVVKDIADGSTAVGVPAKVIKVKEL